MNDYRKSNVIGLSVASKTSAGVPAPVYPKPCPWEQLYALLEKTISVGKALVCANPTDHLALGGAVYTAKFFLDEHSIELRTKINEVNVPATIDQIGTQLLTVLSNPTAANTDNSVFASVLCRDVGAKCPTLYAVQIACWKLRTEKNFIPTNKEVMEALKSAQDILESAMEALDELPTTIEQAEHILSLPPKPMPPTAAEITAQLRERHRRNLHIELCRTAMAMNRDFSHYPPDMIEEAKAGLDHHRKTLESRDLLMKRHRSAVQTRPMERASEKPVATLSKEELAEIYAKRPGDRRA
jgi:hypothetical protein